jgi:hypothetical protein
MVITVIALVLAVQLIQSRGDWAAFRSDRVAEAVANPPKATAALRKAMRTARHPRTG